MLLAEGEYASSLHSLDQADELTIHGRNPVWHPSSALRAQALHQSRAQLGL